MPQIKIYGLRENIEPKRFALSYTINAALEEAIGTSQERRFQRFIALEPNNFIFPSDRSSNYTIIEIGIFEGRSSATKKNLIRLLYRKIAETAGIAPQDLEIIILETPKCNWGINGALGDELQLNDRFDA